MSDKLTLDQVLINSSTKYENNIALSSVDGVSVTYKELKEKVNSVSEFLQEGGVLPGDKVAILSENSVNWGIAYFAITTMGAVGVPIMTEFKSTEIHHILRHSECKVIFVSSKQYEKIEEFKSEEIIARILLDDFSIIPEEIKTDRLKTAVAEGLKEFQKIKFAALKLVGLADDVVEEDDLALILYTS
ncbi:MAG: acyl--CoA ligase, partial [Melioribacteraceae bacterium]|nr:acyl--CoA ligase [Melioribacteraceae bacterium]